MNQITDQTEQEASRRIKEALSQKPEDCDWGTFVLMNWGYLIKHPTAREIFNAAYYNSLDVDITPLTPENSEGEVKWAKADSLEEALDKRFSSYDRLTLTEIYKLPATALAPFQEHLKHIEESGSTPECLEENLNALERGIMKVVDPAKQRYNLYEPGESQLISIFSYATAKLKKLPSRSSLMPHKDAVDNMLIYWKGAGTLLYDDDSFVKLELADSEPFTYPPPVRHGRRISAKQIPQDSLAFIPTGKFHSAWLPDAEGGQTRLASRICLHQKPKEDYGEEPSEEELRRTRIKNAKKLAAELGGDPIDYLDDPEDLSL